MSKDAEIIKTCQQYTACGEETTGEKLINSIRSTEHPIEVLQELLDIVFNTNDERKRSMDVSIINAIVSRPLGRSALADQLTSNPTGTFRPLWDLGEKGMDELIRTSLTLEAWSNPESRRTAIKGVFLLLLAQLLEPEDDEQSEMAVKAIARLMANEASDLEKSIDADNLAIILPFLDIQKPIAIRSQTTLIVAKFLEVSKERGKELVKDYVVPRISKQTVDDVVAGFSVAGALFPIVPDTASGLFLTPGFLEDVVSPVQRSNSKRLRIAALELLSAACIDKDCRLAITVKCTDWLKSVIRNPKSDKDAAMAALVLSKTGQGTTTLNGAKIHDEADSLTSIFCRLVLGAEDTQMQTAIEGLAYSSIQPSSKEEIANDPALLKKITIAMLQPENRGPLVFGGLTIFSNLTTYPVDMTAEQKKMAQLKAYANQSKPVDPSPLECAAHVALRCKRVLEAGVVTVLVKIAKQASPTLLGLIATIVLNLSKERKHCGVMIQQGVMDVIILLCTYGEADAALTAARKIAAQALARLVIPIDPFLVFSNQQNSPNARSIAAAARAFNVLLVELESEDPRPAFEALQALTNLASMGEEICDYITMQCFETIEPYVNSTRSALQQAAMECISNLSACDSCISVFVVEADVKPVFPTEIGGEEDAERHREARFLKLLSLTEDDVRGTRLAAMATLFNITQVVPGVRMLLHAPSGLKRLVSQLGMTENMVNVNGKPAIDADMMARTLCVVCNVLQQGEAKARTALRELGLEKSLSKIKSMGNGDQLAQFKDEALQMLKS